MLSIIEEEQYINYLRELTSGVMLTQQVYEGYFNENRIGNSVKKSKTKIGWYRVYRSYSGLFYVKKENVYEKNDK